MLAHSPLFPIIIDHFHTDKGGVVQVSVQWSKGDSWPVREQAKGASSVGEVEHEWCRHWETGARESKPIKASRVDWNACKW